jgi:hypothetical protein
MNQYPRFAGDRRIDCRLPTSALVSPSHKRRVLERGLRFLPVGPQIGLGRAAENEENAEEVPMPFWCFNLQQR